MNFHRSVLTARVCAPEPCTRKVQQNFESQTEPGTPTSPEILNPNSEPLKSIAKPEKPHTLNHIHLKVLSFKT